MKPRRLVRAWLPAALALLLSTSPAACRATDDEAVFGSSDGVADNERVVGRASEGAIGISDAVIVLPPGGASAAAYMTIGLAVGVDTLLHAELQDGRRVDIHASETIDSRVRMTEKGPLPLSSEESLRLHPGEAHIMIESFDRIPAEGDAVTLVLHFARTGRVEVDALVVRYDQLDSIFAGTTTSGTHAGH